VKKFNLTLIVMVATGAFLLIFDAVIAWLRGRGETISVWITRLSREYSVIPLAFGILMGHFFLQDDIDFSKMRSA